MGGEDDGKAAQAQVAGEPQAQGDEAAAQVAGGAGGIGADDADKARADYEAALRERDERIAALEDEIAEAVRTAESAERLRAEMDELRRQGEEQRVGFELQMAGCRSVKAARALLDDHGGDVDALKEAEPWLFEGGAPKQAGKTGLPNAGAASDEGKTMKRWREIAGIADEE
ncbi:hypothetical protein [Collinsella intestinalis]|uniref:hypothetical protein n=1 Tax=Collinsella intestinalis TaxID=147207 RepID=UPI0019576B52|nr:hypothetical protein [Collinsella intestinalis]MBM6942629.1 hypothetical protein [Collinsella intestinalis]